jgi:hypothetical protein
VGTDIRRVFMGGQRRMEEMIHLVKHQQTIMVMIMIAVDLS